MLEHLNFNPRLIEAMDLFLEKKAKFFLESFSNTLSGVLYAGYHPQWIVVRR